MINDRFITYFRETFFSENEEELQKFLSEIEKPIPRTIRIKKDKISEVKQNLESDGWILSPTNIFNVFSLDRREDFDPLERRIGFSHDHLVGNFYIQELAAAHPVDLLAEHAVQEGEFLILDMASSPGGKTTQLTEYFPNSFIIANEPTRERIPQLLQNTERMGSAQIGITLYPGQLWKQFGEIFDKILLDAPCSGEGTLYKGTDAVKHWHLKNIKEISRLQSKLIDAAFHALKVGGEMVYSTCSLNELENEGVISYLSEKYAQTFEIQFQKKFWPHIDKTGGFFMVKIKKIRSIEQDRSENKARKETSKQNSELRIFHGNISPWNLQPDVVLYEHEGKVLAVKNGSLGERIRHDIYLMRFGEQIGIIDHGKFIPGNRSWKYLDISSTEKYILKDPKEVDIYLRGNIIPNTGSDGAIVIEYLGQTLGLEQRKQNEISNTFSHEWRRK